MGSPVPVPASGCTGNATTIAGGGGGGAAWWQAAIKNDVTAVVSELAREVFVSMMSLLREHPEYTIGFRCTSVS
jgi:spermidine synthase